MQNNLTFEFEFNAQQPSFNIELLFKCYRPIIVCGRLASSVPYPLGPLIA